MAHRSPSGFDKDARIAELEAAAAACDTLIETLRESAATHIRPRIAKAPAFLRG